MNSLKEFCNLVGKYRLLAKICDIDQQTQTLYVAIRELYPHFCEFVNVVLVENNVAKYVVDIEKNDQQTDNFNIESKLTLPRNLQVKMEAPHLFPSFEMLESGKAPCSLMEFNQIKNVDVQLATLLPNYFKSVQIYKT